jgi:uncharacterized protein (UPF0276 family)
MTKLLQACEPLPTIPAGIGPAVTRASRIAQMAWLCLRRVLSARDVTPALMEWDNDVPPFPIFTGEVTRAEASLVRPTRQHRRRLPA